MDDCWVLLFSPVPWAKLLHKGVSDVLPGEYALVFMKQGLVVYFFREGFFFPLRSLHSRMEGSIFQCDFPNPWAFSNKWGPLERSMLMAYPELLMLQRQIVEKVKGLKVIPLVELLYEEFLARLSYKSPPSKGKHRYWFTLPLYH